jgi:hypothetical protein
MAEFDIEPATHGRCRVRGFASWNPQPATRELLTLVQAILVEYTTYLPLTLRQIFYRLVGAHNYPKTEDAYHSFCEHMNRARRARLIDFNAIRDDGFFRSGLLGYVDSRAFLTSCRAQAGNYRRDRQAGQMERLVVWCEAQGMTPQLERVANPYGVEVLSSGGFDSTTIKHELASEFATLDTPARVLHLGDYDPSGEHIFSSLAADISAFCATLGGVVTFERVAVTPAHIERFNLSTAPPKPTDKRSFDSNVTVQLEALPPDVLAGLLREAIGAQIDMDVLSRLLDTERGEREDLEQQLAQLGAAS